MIWGEPQVCVVGLHRKNYWFTQLGFPDRRDLSWTLDDVYILGTSLVNLGQPVLGANSHHVR